MGSFGEEFHGFSYNSELNNGSIGSEGRERLYEQAKYVHLKIPVDDTGLSAGNESADDFSNSNGGLVSPVFG